MANIDETCASLRAQIAVTETQLAGLKRDLANAEKAAATTSETAGKRIEGTNGTGSRWPLLQEEYRRYGRQMIVPQIGLEGERLLRTESVVARACEMATDDHGLFL